MGLQPTCGQVEGIGVDLCGHPTCGQLESYGDVADLCGQLHQCTLESVVFLEISGVGDLCGHLHQRTLETAVFLEISRDNTSDSECLDGGECPNVHPANITPHSHACCLRHLGLCLGWQTFCSNPMALNGSALNNSGSITPHSHACCSLRHLGVGLGWQTFCYNLREKINVANPSLVRVPQ